MAFNPAALGPKAACQKALVKEVNTLLVFCPPSDAFVGALSEPDIRVDV